MIWGWWANLGESLAVGPGPQPLGVVGVTCLYHALGLTTCCLQTCCVEIGDEVTKVAWIQVQVRVYLKTWQTGTNHDSILKSGRHHTRETRINRGKQESHTGSKYQNSY